MRNPKYRPLPPKLGVGFTLLHGWEEEQRRLRPLIDFYEMSPDAFSQDVAHGDGRRMVYHPEAFAAALQRAADLPLVVHGLNLSIGSATGWNEDYVQLLDGLAAQRDFAWHSEHLGYMVSEGPRGEPLHAGVLLPLPFTDEAVDLVAGRARQMAARHPVPFLLENLTHYLPDLPAEHGRDEVAFLNDLVEAADGWLLLDLYNFHCNARNFGFDARRALSRLRLDRVAQIHVAGGVMHEGLLLDVHSRMVPEPVWELLDFVVTRAPNLGGIVYELLEQAMHFTGPVVHGELARVRRAWRRHCEAFGVGEERRAAR